MGIFEDVYDEWKKASPKQKWVIGGVSGGAIALALYLHRKSSSTPGTGTTGLPSGFQTSTGGTGGPPPNDGGGQPGPNPNPGPGQGGPPPGPQTRGRWITVGKDVPVGTTLQQIAIKFGITLSQLLSMNAWAQGYDPNLAGNIDNQVVQIARPMNAPVSSSRPSKIQPTRTTGVYAQTRHAPPARPHTPSKQMEPPPHVEPPPVKRR